MNSIFIKSVIIATLVAISLSCSSPRGIDSTFCEKSLHELAPYSSTVSGPWKTFFRQHRRDIDPDTVEMIIEEVIQGIEDPDKIKIRLSQMALDTSIKSKKTLNGTYRVTHVIFTIKLDPGSLFRISRDIVGHVSIAPDDDGKRVCAWNMLTGP